MRIQKIFILGIVLILGISLADALDNYISTNKILLSPFYRDSMVSGVNYTYTVAVNPPDKISYALSSIIYFEGYINPTVVFSMWVNKIPCNTPAYTISTTYAGASQASLSFDCTNVISKAGNYNITLTSTKATGASTMWLDIAYINNQSDYVGIVGNVETVDNVSSVGTVDTCKSVDVVDSVTSVTSVDTVKGVVESRSASMDIHGTEYTPNDHATMFVQLRDSYGGAVSNGACYLHIWSPLNSSGVHPILLDHAPMMNLGSEGMYYYDMFVPNNLGVHMLSADCEYSFSQRWIYPLDEAVYYPIPTRITGAWIGSAQSLNDKGDDSYERCDSTSVILCQSTYQFNISQYGVMSNISSVNLYFAGQGDSAGKTVTFAYWNGTVYVNLPNIFTVVATGATATTVGNVDIFVTNSVPLSSVIDGIITIRYTGQMGLARLYNNWLSLSILSSTGSIQDIKGSSEMHVTNIPSATSSLSSSQIPSYIWNHTNRNLTYYPAQTDLTNYTKIQDVVWNKTIRNLTYYPPATADINYTLVADSVWSYSGTIVDNILSQIATIIWEYLGARAEII